MILSAHQSALLQGKSHRILRQNVSESLEQFQLTIPEWTLLALLQNEEGMRLSGVADLLGVESPLVTMLVKQLQEKKLIGIKPDTHDSRAKCISLTKLGIDVLPTVERVVNERLQVLMVGISREDLSVYFGVQEKIIKNASSAEK